MKKPRHRISSTAVVSPVAPAPATNGKPPTDPEYLGIRHASYCKQREALNAAGLEVSGRYDQWILSLSGGALALSLGFLEKIAPSPAPATKPWIVLAWIGLILSLVSGFASIFFSQRACDRQIQILDEEFSRFKDQRSGPKLQNRSCKITEYLNWTSLVTFTLGLVFLCIFAFTNFPGNLNQSEEKPQAGTKLGGTTNELWTTNSSQITNSATTGGPQ